MPTALLLLGGAWGCTEPRFASTADAGRDGLGGPDVALDARASTPFDAGTPGPGDASPSPHTLGTPTIPEAVRAELRGSYARRSTFFAIDSTSGNEVMNRGTELALVDIEDDGNGGLVWHTRLCDMVIDDALGTHVAVRAPARLPAFDLPMVLAPDASFSVPLGRIALGYAPERFDDPACQPLGSATRRARYEDQTWSVDAAHYADADAWNGARTCACAPSANDLPGMPTDCRLNDADGDGEPGITLDASTALGVAAFTWSVALEYSVAYEQGSRSDDGSLHVLERHVLRPSCVDRAAQTCNTARSLPCRPETSETLIVPVDAGIRSCSDLLAGQNAVFLSQPPGFRSTECVSVP